MLNTRVIPVLLLRDNGLVKTVKFDKHKYIGDPINAVRIFNEKEVDELIFLDIDASKKGNEPDYGMINNIASECFMPLGYGGGISSVDQIRKLFSIGVEKVVINTAALKDISIIEKGAHIFGSQSIIASIDAKKNIIGKFVVYSHSFQKVVESDVLRFAKQLEEAGSGEIILNFIDKDGTMSGYDTNFIKRICSDISIPIISCGGAGSLYDFRQAVKAGASAVAAGSIFVYHGPHQAVLINYPTQKELRAILHKI